MNVDNIKTFCTIVFVLAIFSSGGESLSAPAAFGYNQAEYSELFQTMAFLSCKREESLEKRMEQLSAYHKLLLQSWLLSGQTSMLAIRNKIGSSPSIDLADNYPDIYHDFNEAWLSSLQKANSLRSTDEEKRESADYWGRLAEVDLKLLHEHIEDGLHSAEFISDSFQAIQWLYLTDQDKENVYNILFGSIKKTNEMKLRRSIFDALFFFRKYYSKVCEDFADDSDVYISKQSLAWLVAHGRSDYLLRYIDQSWKLFNSGGLYLGSNFSDKHDLQALLTEIIPESGTLLEEQDQLEWVKNHKLRWNDQTKHYEIDKN